MLFYELTLGLLSDSAGKIFPESENRMSFHAFTSALQFSISFLQLFTDQLFDFDFLKNLFFGTSSSTSGFSDPT